MHFSKTYSQLLLTLPRELQENAIKYRQLKKLINKLVNELALLGLNPSVLQTLLQPGEAGFSDSGKGKERAYGERPGEVVNSCVVVNDVSRSCRPTRTKAVYEVVHDGGHIQPRLRIQVASAEKDADSGIEGDERPRSPARIDILDTADSTSVNANASHGKHELYEPSGSEKDFLIVAKPIVARPGQSLIWTLQKSAQGVEDAGELEAQDAYNEEYADADARYCLYGVHPVELIRKQTRLSVDETRELIIPLESDTAFFQLLYSALQTLSSHLHIVRSNFISNLESLASSISHTARPQSALPGSFHPLSSYSDPRDVTAPLLSPFSSSFVPGGKTKSDLYAWRVIFQLYVDAEVFESVHERDRGERDIGEAERRLALFAEQVTTRGLNDRRKLRFKESRDALESFLQLNVLILNLKKFQYANAEAARKILKKHAKRTALPFPIPRLDASTATLQVDSQIFPLLHTEHLGASQTSILTLIPTSMTSLPHMLVQGIGETLLPIIPHLDDYSCLICTSIAFKPIRLNCGHIFCVRCLVKMQKRGQDHCPCCRAPTVLMADRSNVDWAMLNFMRDWFPRETAKKLNQNEKEAAQEQLEELGIPDQSCIMA